MIQTLTGSLVSDNNSKYRLIKEFKIFFNIAHTPVLLLIKELSSSQKWSGEKQLYRKRSYEWLFARPEADDREWILNQAFFFSRTFLKFLKLIFY